MRNKNKRKKPKCYPIIDIFAGPGGLGEGFSSVGQNGPRFRSILSIERDESAHKTLLLRHFVRSFSKIPEEYYLYLENKITIDKLFSIYKKQYKAAQKAAVQISLGEENHNLVRSMINKRLNGVGKWVLMGGPPCQAYSLVGRSRMKGLKKFYQDERHFLYKEYLKIIVDHEPPVFVMENVKGLLSSKLAKGSKTISKIISDLTNPSKALEKKRGGLAYQLYSLSQSDIHKESEIDPRSFIVRSEDYGVPQSRHRVFIVGVRKDLNVRLSELKPHRAPTVAETIGNLPRIRSGLSRGTDNFEGWRKELFALNNVAWSNLKHKNVPDTETLIKGINSYIRRIKKHPPPSQRSSIRYSKLLNSDHIALKSMFDPKLKVLVDHNSRSHMASDLRRYAFAAIYAQKTKRTPKLSCFPDELLPNHKNISQGCLGQMFSDRFRVQLGHKVASTITSHISKDGHYFIHYDPTQCRSLTVREAARLQTFPDNYKFEGNRTSQYHQIGNAVPPYLAKQIGEIVAEILDNI